MMLIMGAVSVLSACGAGSSTAVSAIGTVSTALSQAAVTYPNGTTTLTITVSNTSSTAVTGGALTIPMLTGGAMTNYQTTVGSPCTMTSISYGNGGTFALGGLMVPPSAICTNTITIKPSSRTPKPGTHVFTPSGLTNITADITATLTVN